jgi:predicted ATPase
MSDPSLIDSLRAAVAARPDDHRLRLHLAEQLLTAGRAQEAVAEAGAVLAVEPQVDWSALERDLDGVIPARFAADDAAEAVTSDHDRIFDVERSGVRLVDVGGLDEVKKRLELAFLGPLRNPKLRALYGKSLRGGLLLYGPPGCGKTFLARAVAGDWMPTSSPCP